MRILYGVVGEGMGHAMRSAVVLEWLIARGHEVRILVSGRAAHYLEARYPGCVSEITGLTMIYEDNRVRKLKTAFENFKSLSDVPANLASYVNMALEFSPQVVISDFESIAYWFAKNHRIPILSIDNMQVISRCHHDDALIEDDKRAFLLAKGLVRAKLPRSDHYLITTFFYPPVKRERTTLHPPILREVILDAKARVTRGEHVLVYQSGTSHDALVSELEQVDVPFKVYGLRRDIDAPVVERNLTHCPFSESQFIEDLASARAVIAGGGFTLMGEAIYLQKPMLTIPLVGQYEQVLNKNYLVKLGYGEGATRVTAEVVQRFLAHAPAYADNLQSFEHDRNLGLFAQLGQLIDTLGAKAR